EPALRVLAAGGDGTGPPAGDGPAQRGAPREVVRVTADDGDAPLLMLVASALAVLRAGATPRRAEGAGPGPRAILLRPTADPLWVLAAHALAAAATEAGAAVEVLPALTGATPDLLAEAERADPCAVVLLGVVAAGDHAAVTRLAAARPTLPVFVNAGEGPAENVPWGEHVHRVRSFAGTLHEVLAVCR